MDWQEAIALGIVAVTSIVMMLALVRRRRGARKGGGCGCDCPLSSMGEGTPKVTYRPVPTRSDRGGGMDYEGGS